MLNFYDLFRNRFPHFFYLFCIGERLSMSDDHILLLVVCIDPTTFIILALQQAPAAKRDFSEWNRLYNTDA